MTTTVDLAHGVQLPVAHVPITRPFVWLHRGWEDLSHNPAASQTTLLRPKRCGCSDGTRRLDQTTAGNAAAHPEPGGGRSGLRPCQSARAGLRFLDDQLN